MNKTGKGWFKNKLDDKAPQLNIFTTPEEDVRTAFDMMEHDGFYDASRYSPVTGDSRYEIKGWFNAYERLKAAEAHSLRELELVRAGDADTIKDIVSDWPERYSNMSQEELVAQLEQELIEYHGPNKSCGGAIYGDGGWNRYWIRYGGDIGFSAGHAQHPQKETIQNARDLGFHVF